MAIYQLLDLDLGSGLLGCLSGVFRVLRTSEITFEQLSLNEPPIFMYHFNHHLHSDYFAYYYSSLPFQSLKPMAARVSNHDIRIDPK